MNSCQPPETDHGLARWLAGRAGRRLLTLRSAMGYDDPQTLRDTADRCSHELIVGELGRWRPSDPVLSEEGDDPSGRCRARRVWIVDPLDGTREFGEPERADWAVHIGLWCDGGLVAGAVALPAVDRVLATDTPPPYPRSGDSGVIRIAVSRTRPPVLPPTLPLRPAAAVARVVPVPIGSAGAKIVAVIDGAVDAYVHRGVQHEWDSAAPVAVALAVGLHISHLDGTPLAYNQSDPTVHDLLICRRELALPLLATFR